MVAKIFGGLLIAAGIVMIFVFPDIVEYQFKQLSHTGVLIGIILLIAGLYLLLV